ncbi:radical SAM protein [Calditrichota bacterium]
MSKPSYLNLYSSGELKNRVRLLNEKLQNCNVCPYECNVNRVISKTGFCRSGQFAYVVSYCDHHGEEPPLSGIHGSGTIFMGNCNLRCVFCQNADISQRLYNLKSYEYTAEKLAELILYLQNVQNCHNINFVSPSHFVPQIVEGIYIAAGKGLNLPLVYNSNGYDALDTLKLINGIFDIYLPDLKYSNDINARKYSRAKNYVNVSRAAIKEMFRQVGILQVDEDGIAKQGLIIRHLVLPNDISGTIDCLEWIAKELSTEVTISLMAQYYPANYADRIPLLSRKIKRREYDEALMAMERFGLTEGLCQRLISADHYKPHFFNSDHPFE